MKVQWEAHDVRGGRKCIHRGGRKTDSEVILAFSVGMSSNTWMVVSMSDGQSLVQDTNTKVIAEWLNREGFEPKELYQ